METVCAKLFPCQMRLMCSCTPQMPCLLIRYMLHAECAQKQTIIHINESCVFLTIEERPRKVILLMIWQPTSSII